MLSFEPEIAIVRPRAMVGGTRDVRLLEELVAELAEDVGSGLVRLDGPLGSGRTTALAHLAAVFAGDDRFIFLDEPTAEELVECRQGTIVVAATPATSQRSAVQLTLEPWRSDEFIEYLSAEHHGCCGSVMQRLGAAGNRPWTPSVARIVLDSFAKDANLVDPAEAILNHVRTCLTVPKHFKAACRFAFIILVRAGSEVEQATIALRKSGCSDELRSLLLQDVVQELLSAEFLMESLGARGSLQYFSRKLPYSLVEVLGERVSENAKALARLQKTLESDSEKHSHPMVASVLLAADPTWRPAEPDHGVQNLSHAYLCEADWPEIELSRADLSFADFTDARLEQGIVDCAHAGEATFDRVNLRDAKLPEITAIGASFRQALLVRADLTKAILRRADLSESDLSEAQLTHADLRDSDLRSALLVGADLTGANLVGAKLEDADLASAVMRNANLTDADLRNSCLREACLEGAILCRAQMEDIRLPNAQFAGAALQSAHLTGSIMPGANLRKANLAGAGLGEIEWEDADLRGADLHGATFHMGSSRSGLVGSPIACEGSKTGFYTDDYEEMHFKRPEEVRKANLRGADLRGANIDRLDFYLVDLRGARLDPSQLVHVRQCGAILEDRIA